jgi:lipase maturation factor 1
MEGPGGILPWLFDSRSGLASHLIPRWIFLRALALIYFSAFYSLLFQIDGLIGPQGILPAKDYLAAVGQSLHGINRFWYAPSLFWLSSSSHMLLAVTWIGLLAAVCALLNLWPRLSLLACFVCFLSFVSSSSDFSSYQSDGMLLEAGFLSFFLAPPGLRPGWGPKHPPIRAAYFLLLWEWFRIYFESGLVKWLSGDPQWRNLTALDDYYQNGPLPSWVGWYAAHLPHWFHVATAGGTLLLEFIIVLMLFFPRRVRIICFCIVTPWQACVILTANYTFLNYLVLSLGFLLLDDKLLNRFVPARFKLPLPLQPAVEDEAPMPPSGIVLQLRSIRLAIAAVLLTWVGYATTAELVGMVLRPSPLPNAPVELLEPFRIANQYGLFAVMTRGRYEIEFQGSNDNQNWTPYPFRYKPQALGERPGLYAPYQPRFDWNLWFASLGDWRQNQIVPLTEERLLANDASVLYLFRSNPFPTAPPRYVRAVLWQYWFTSMEEKRRTGNWWRRSLLGQYAPTLTYSADGKVTVVAEPDLLPPHE